MVFYLYFLARSVIKVFETVYRHTTGCVRTFVDQLIPAPTIRWITIIIGEGWTHIKRGLLVTIQRCCTQRVTGVHFLWDCQLNNTFTISLWLANNARTVFTASKITIKYFSLVKDHSNSHSYYLSTKRLDEATTETTNYLGLNNDQQWDSHHIAAYLNLSLNDRLRTI